MGNVHPYPRYLSREPSCHSHPTPMKKYGLLYTHLGCKSAIKGTVHLLFCKAKMLLTLGSIRLVPPAKTPFPCLPCCNPQPAVPTQHKKTTFIREVNLPRLTLALSLFSHFSEPLDTSIGHISARILARQTAPHTQHSQCCPPRITDFPCPPLRFDSHVPSRQSHFCTGPSGLAFLYVTLCD